KTPEQFGAISDACQNDASFDGIASEQGLRSSNQRRGGRKQAQPIPDHEVPGWRQVRVLQVVDRGAKRKIDLVVGPPRAVDDGLSGDDSILGVQQQRMLGREMPLVAKTRVAVAGAEFPEGC